LPTQYALFAPLHVCVNDAAADAVADAGRPAGDAGAPPGPALAGVVAAAPPPLRASRAMTRSAAAPRPPRTTGVGRRDADGGCADGADFSGAEAIASGDIGDAAGVDGWLDAASE
jgi:hypothetical protein